MLFDAHNSDLNDKDGVEEKVARVFKSEAYA